MDSILPSFKLLTEQLFMSWLPRSAYLALIAGSAFTLSQAIWQLIPAPVEATPSFITHALPLSPKAVKSNSINNRQSIKKINQAHLFGTPITLKKKKSVVPTAPIRTALSPKIEETRLDLELKGIIVANNTKLSLAIIANKQRQER